MNVKLESPLQAWCLRKKTFTSSTLLGQAALPIKKLSGSSKTRKMHLDMHRERERER